VGGASYDQTTFRTQVQATFLTPSATTTYAALIVQTPQDPTKAGGYVFALAPNGRWRLQTVPPAARIYTIAEGTVKLAAGSTSGSATSAVLGVAVQQGLLTATVNGQPVVRWTDGLGPDALVGLMVERDEASPSAVVQFNAFELDQWG
jgi:hypothetical protein